VGSFFSERVFFTLRAYLRLRSMSQTAKEGILVKATAETRVAEN
jgi:hypothetical protein